MWFPKFNAKVVIELYKCFILTVIAIIIILSTFNIPVKIFGLQNYGIDKHNIGLVRVLGGDIDVSGSVEIENVYPIEVEVSNTVGAEVVNTVEVEGNVYCY